MSSRAFPIVIVIAAIFLVSITSLFTVRETQLALRVAFGGARAVLSDGPFRSPGEGRHVRFRRCRVTPISLNVSFLIRIYFGSFSPPNR